MPLDDTLERAAHSAHALSQHSKSIVNSLTSLARDAAILAEDLEKAKSQAARQRLEGAKALEDAQQKAAKALEDAKKAAEELAETQNALVPVDAAAHSGKTLNP